MLLPYTWHYTAGDVIVQKTGANQLYITTATLSRQASTRWRYAVPRLTVSATYFGGLSLSRLVGTPIPLYAGNAVIRNMGARSAPRLVASAIGVMYMAGRPGV